jgi:tetratricopeptide (TPR) repeat protein
MVREGTIPELVRSLQRARTEAVDRGRPLARAIFFIGAGCSRSAGVPLAAEIARGLVPKLAQTYDLSTTSDPEAALKVLQAAGHFLACSPGGTIDWYAVYDEVFLNHYKTPDNARNIFRKAIEESFKGINWAHLCLGELVSQKFCSTIITTNFDLLALEGLVAAGVIPVVSDGLESLGRISGYPDYPQLIQLNGSIHSYRLRNRPDEIEAVGEHSAAASCFRELIRDADVITFVGYAGREVAIMKLLSAAMQEFSEKEVYWCSYGNALSSISTEATKLMDGNANARVILNQDADLFFYELCRDLGVGAPAFIRNPLSSIQSRATGIALPEGGGHASEIRNEIERFNKKISALTNRDPSEGLDTQSAILDQASAQRFKGDDRAALNTIAPLLAIENPDPQVLAFASIVANSIAARTLAPDDMERAVVLARQAMEALTDADEPERVDAQIRYAKALDIRGLGKSESDDAKLALKNFREAVGKIDPVINQELWLSVQNTIGVIHARIADVDNSDPDIAMAIAAFDEVIALAEKFDLSEEAQRALTNKGVALFTQGEYKRDVGVIRQAIQVLEDVNKKTSKTANLPRWNVQVRCLASCYGAISMLENDVASAEESVRLTKESMEPDVTDDPSHLAGIEVNYGRALGRLAEMRKDADVMEEGLRHVRSAQSKFTEMKMDWHALNAQKTADALLEALNEIKGSGTER